MAKANCTSLHNCVKVTAPEPRVLRTIGADSKRNGTNKLTTRQIDQIIQKTRGRA